VAPWATTCSSSHINVSEIEINMSTKTCLVPRPRYFASVNRFQVTWFEAAVRLGYVTEMNRPLRPRRKPYRNHAVSIYDHVNLLDFTVTSSKKEIVKIPPGKQSHQDLRLCGFSFACYLEKCFT